MSIRKQTIPFIPYLTKHKTYARENRSSPTYAEKIVRETMLRKKQTGRKFTRQKPIGAYIVDFRCSKLMLVIEIDGYSHIGNEEYDAYRTKDMATLGIKVLRYTNEESIYYTDQMYLDICKKLQQRSNQLT